MKNGWYKVIAEAPNPNTGKREILPFTLLYINNTWYQDFDRNSDTNVPFRYPILSVGTSEPIMGMDHPINCDYDNLMNFVSEIFARAIKDYQSQLVTYHFSPTKELATSIRYSEKILEGIRVHGQDVIKGSRAHAKYMIFRKEHKCGKCRQKKCPHRGTNNHPQGTYRKFGKVGCVKDET